MAATLVRNVGVAAALGFVATVLVGCGEDKMHMDLTYSCNSEGLGTQGCKSWVQTGTTGSKDEPEAFKVNVGYDCSKWSTKTSQCIEWHQTGKAVHEKTTSCFPRDAIVLTRAGPVQLSQVSIGDELLGVDRADDSLRFSKIRAWFHRDLDAEDLMTTLTTSEGRVLVSAKHSLATRPGHYVFADDLDVGDAVWSHTKGRVTVQEKTEVVARGLMAPLTESSNFFVGESEKSMILAHSFAHVRRPWLWEGMLHSILDIAEFFCPEFSAVKDDRPYIHPIGRYLGFLFGIHVDGKDRHVS